MATVENSTANAAVEYYVYVYWRDDLTKPTPFYVGKGKGDRVRKMRSRNPDFLRIVKSLETAGTPPRVEVTDLMTEADALALEIELIEFYGRSDRGHGPLVNRTRGGDGLKDVHKSAEFRAAAREQMAALRGRPEIEARRIEAMRAAAKCDATKAKHAAQMNDRYADQEQRDIQSKRMKETWASGDYKEAHSKGISKAWQDKDHRKKVIDGIRKSLREGGAEQRSKTMKEKFAGAAGEERRAKIAAASAARWADPAYRERLSIKGKSVWSGDDGTRRENASKKLSEMHNLGKMRRSQT